MTEVLHNGAALGDRFVALLGAPDGAGWSGADELLGPALTAVLAAVGAARGTDSPAVAAALLFEQYALRLTAPVFATLHRDGQVLDARLPLVRAQFVDGAVRRLAFARPPAAGTSGAVLDGLVAGNLEPVAAALHRHTRVGMRVLRGAMANAATSALLHLSWPHADRAHHVGDAHELLARLPGWAGLVNVRAVEVAGDRWMYTDRNTCCLAFRTTVNQGREQRYCATCPVVPRATTAAMFTDATASYAARHPS